jgi:hypothetical protein
MITNINGVFVTAGNSATGSFTGIMSLGTGSQNAISGSTITGLKYYSGYNASGTLTEGSFATPFTLPAGVTLPLAVTSCSLAAGSAPIILFTS